MENLAVMAHRIGKEAMVTTLELQKSTGHMCFAARAVRAARTSARLRIDVIRELREDSHRARVTELMQKELLWWENIAPKMNGL